MLDTPAGRLPFFLFIFHFSFFGKYVALGEGWCVDSKVTDRTLLVQAHDGTLVHAHVSVTQETTCLALDALRVQGVQLLWGHF